MALAPEAASDIILRPAGTADVEALEALIRDSARELSRGFYTDRQTAAAIDEVFGVDSELIADGTYFLIEKGGALAACGGWSKRRTLFGGDSFAGRSSELLDPSTEPARIRAFFVAPRHARQGLGTVLLAHCEQEARQAGFASLALMATLPGVPLYTAAGFKPEPGISLSLAGGTVDVPFVPMSKSLAGRTRR